MTVLIWGIFSNAYHSACVWPIALKIGCVTNVKMLFLVVGACLIDESLCKLAAAIFACVCVRGGGGGGGRQNNCAAFSRNCLELSTESYGSMFKYERRTISRGRVGYTKGTQQSIQ